MWCRSGGLALGGVGVLARDVPAFPPLGIIGSWAAASRTPCGRRCAAGLRPVLDPAARSRGMAAAREGEQECLHPVGS